MNKTGGNIASELEFALSNFPHISPKVRFPSIYRLYIYTRARVCVWFVSESFVGDIFKQAITFASTQLNGFKYSCITPIILFSIDQLFAHKKVWSIAI